MPTTLLITILLAIGVPLSAAVRRRPEAIGWPALLLEAGALAAALLWVVAALTVAFGGLHVGIVLATGLGAAMVAAMIGLRGGHLQPCWPARPGETVATALIVGVAAWLRAPPVQYVFGGHPMGQHLTEAHRVALGAAPSDTLPAGWTVWLALCEALCGDALAGQPVLAMLAFGLALAALWQVDAPPWARLGVAGLLAVGTTPGWLGRLPIAADLVAVFAAGGLYLLVRGLRTGRAPLGAAAGLLFGVAWLAGWAGLAPAAVGLLLPWAAALAWEPAERGVARLTAMGTGVGFWVALALHGALSTAWVHAGLAGLPPLWEAAAVAGELDRASLASVAVVLVAVAITTSGAEELASRREQRERPVWVVAAAVALVGLALATHPSTARALAHTAGLLALFAGAGLVARPDRASPAAVAAGALLAAGLLLPVPTADGPFPRLDGELLVAAALPAIVVLAGVGQASLPARRATALLVAIALAVFGGLSLQAWSALPRRVPTPLDALARLDRAAGPADVPLIYVGMSPLPRGWPAPNSWTLLVPPLEGGFGRRVLNVAGRDPTAVDPLPTVESARVLLRDVEAPEAVVVVPHGRGGGGCDAWDDEIGAVTVPVPGRDGGWIPLAIDLCRVRARP